MSHRIKRFSSTLKQSLAYIILNDLNNPLLKSISITQVMVSPDLKKARVYFSSTACEDPDDLIRQLDGAKGFIKRNLARKMYLKYIPELSFIKDDNIREFQMNKENEKENC